MTETISNTCSETRSETVFRFSFHARDVRRGLPLMKTIRFAPDQYEIVPARSPEDDSEDFEQAGTRASRANY
jgi:hypothetical protein